MLLLFLLSILNCARKNDSNSIKNILIGSWHMKKSIDNQYYEIYLSEDFIYTFQDEVISSMTKYQIRNDSIIYIYDEDSINDYGTRLKIYNSDLF